MSIIYTSQPFRNLKNKSENTLIVYISRFDHVTSTEYDLQIKRRLPAFYKQRRELVKRADKTKNEQLFRDEFENWYYHISLRNKEDEIDARGLDKTVIKLMRFSKFLDISSMSIYEHAPSKEEQKKFFKGIAPLDSIPLDVLVYRDSRGKNAGKSVFFL